MVISPISAAHRLRKASDPSEEVVQEWRGALSPKFKAGSMTWIFIKLAFSDGFSGTHEFLVQML